MSGEDNPIPGKCSLNHKQTVTGLGGLSFCVFVCGWSSLAFLARPKNTAGRLTKCWMLVLRSARPPWRIQRCHFCVAFGFIYVAPGCSHLKPPLRTLRIRGKDFTLLANDYRHVTRMI